MGLGDAIAFASIAVKLADGKDLEYPCWARDEVSVRSIFANHPNIKPVVVDRAEEQSWYQKHDDCIKIGAYSGPPLDHEDAYDWICRTAGMQNEDRFNGLVRGACFNVKQKQLWRTPSGGKYGIKHDDKDRGYVMKRVPLDGAYYHVTADGESILSWRDRILDAHQIHCIDSSFLHLVEQLEPEGDLYFHLYARHDSRWNNFKKRHNWTTLE